MFTIAELVGITFYAGVIVLSPGVYGATGASGNFLAGVGIGNIAADGTGTGITIEAGIGFCSGTTIGNCSGIIFLGKGAISGTITGITVG